MSNPTDSPDGLAETWTMHTPRGSFTFSYKAGEGPEVSGKKPIWMTKLNRTWDNPSEPIKFVFTLGDESYVQDAFNFLYNGPANGIKYPGEES